MSSYWDAALRAGHGLHGTAEPRPRARFEDDGDTVEAFQPMEIEQEVRTPTPDADKNIRVQPQHHERTDQISTFQSADSLAEQPVPATRPDIQHDMVALQLDSDIHSPTADNQSDRQPEQSATLEAVAAPVVQQSNAVILSPESSQAEAAAVPLVQIHEYATIAEVVTDRPTAQSEPILLPAFAAPEAQNAVAQPLVVAAEPVITGTARLEEQHPQQPQTLLITIDSIDIRIGAESSAMLSPSRRVQPPVVALQDYLAHRSGGNA
jgi:hypothetical protein